jgi:hypothetical protein
MPKLFIHIGHGKTGSTSLQHFLSTCSRQPESPFAFPQTCQIKAHSGHHELFQAGAFPTSRWKLGQDKEMCEALFQEIEKTNKSRIILSSEAGLPGLGRRTVGSSMYQLYFFERLRKFFDLYVVYYVRNQFEHLESAFYTDCRIRGIEPTEQRFNSYFENRACEFNFLENIDSFWSRLVGRQNILSKTYHKNNLLNNDIVQDFLALTNIDDESIMSNDSFGLELNRTPQYGEAGSRGLLVERKYDEILEYYLESNFKYAEKYLDETSTRYLLENFSA